MMPEARPVGDMGVLLVFGSTVDPAVFDRILALDAALNADPLPGMVETVPAYVTLLIEYDPLVTEFAVVAAAACARLEGVQGVAPEGRTHVIPMLFDGAPDLEEVATRTGLSVDAVVAAHLAAEYRVYMYGFAPGYAYMDGVPKALQLARKPVPVRSRPVGTVMIAGGQCLITTLPMPTGWWVIGQTEVAVLRIDDPEPFLFRPGDRVRFVPA
jgi:inhibitor of KinA